MGLSAFDFLLRDEHHASAPGGCKASISAARFLCNAFDEWLSDPEPCDVRLFRTIIALLLSSRYSTDSLGLHPLNVLGISSSGNWELLDVLRICFADAWKTPFNVFGNSVDEVASSKDFWNVLNWKYDLSDDCIAVAIRIDGESAIFSYEK